MDTKLSFKQKQLPRLSMQMWLPLLQCSLSDLDKHLQVITTENPCIEVKSQIQNDSEVLKKVTSDKSFTYKQGFYSKSGEATEWFSVAKQSLFEKIDEQIAAPLFPTPISQKIAKQILYNINAEGYFEGERKEIAKVCGVDVHQVESVRQRFAYLEPSGVGAVDYKESFLFQTSDIEMDDELSILVSAMIINFDHLERYVDHKRFHDAKEIIRHLKNPPALEYMESSKQVIPDLYIVFEKDTLRIKVNDALYPDIEVTQIDKYDNFAKQKFKEARELVKLMDLRKSTLYNLALVLIEKQYSFFMGGELKPLKLQDVADILGFNESTISRAIHEKYFECDRGVFSFKELFSNAIGAVATSEIKHYLEYLVNGENKENPLSDKDLHEMIEERFKIQMVRRSIAKYRNELDIPSFKERKFLYKLELV